MRPVREPKPSSRGGDETTAGGTGAARWLLKDYLEEAAPLWQVRRFGEPRTPAGIPVDRDCQLACLASMSES